ncbi:sensor histidine kinase [Gracilimonas sp.]|uniref:sensor histidine kinase n=1 Tax=Gracilimonas sp. TaxID=1974203 RepID=UPI0028727D96|nr:histidine kinase [Gracilimonas sp.]
MNKKTKQQIVSYLLFWAISFYIGLEVFSYDDEYKSIDYIYTFLFHVPLVYAVSMHSFHLVPNYLAKSRFWVYGITTLLGLYGSTIPLYTLTFDVFAGWLFPNYYLVRLYSGLEFIGIVTLYLILSSSMEFARSWFSSLKAQQKISELQSEKKASELKALRAQVNPHFLFNSLNTIYSEALKKSEKAPKLILQLSDMLRYVVDKMDMDSVPLEEEIDYLKNYFLLHKERLNDPDKAAFNLEVQLSNQKIAPLLLINFIENTFKHADLSADDSFISIHLSVEQNTLKLKSENTFYENQSDSEKSSGTGFQNAKRRLELAYPGRHSLSTSTNKNTYTLELTMELE